MVPLVLVANKLLFGTGDHMMSSFQGVGLEKYRDVLISGGCNREVQRCPYFRGLD